MGIFQNPNFVTELHFCCYFLSPRLVFQHIALPKYTSVVLKRGKLYKKTELKNI